MLCSNPSEIIVWGRGSGSKIPNMSPFPGAVPDVAEETNLIFLFEGTFSRLGFRPIF